MPTKPASAADPPEDCAALSDDRPPAAATPRHWLGHATEPHILYPGIAVFVLALIWGTTLNLITVKHAAAERAAATSVDELAVTYESQVLRALREIDQTLKLVRYAYGLKGGHAVLQELKARTLLPPELLFAVSIADSRGNIVASTHPAATANVVGDEYFQSQRPSDALAVGRSRRDPASAEWQLYFSRGLNSDDGGHAGLVMVTVDASYFVSGYEISKLGGQGVLGLLGTDGVFRVRRSGETVAMDDAVRYASLVPAVDQAHQEVRPVTNPWDGVRRYIHTHRLFEFPFAVLVGLSVDEQLAGARRDARVYLWAAAAASLLMLAVIAALGRLSWQLALSRRRADHERMAHTERIQNRAYHDDLTSLPNRSLFSRLLGQSLSLAHRHARQLAVLFLDLDGFKHINDTLGHGSGDLLLQEVATRLKACVRDSDTVARLGGDEFVVLLPDLTAEQHVATVATKILSAVARSFVLVGQEVCVTASLGISVYPEDGLDEQTLMKNADLAMYRAKELGRNNYQFHSRKPDAADSEIRAAAGVILRATP